MAFKRRCQECNSRKWHKGPSGITCSEGHILQNYRNETNEAADFGQHAMRKRTLKSTRMKKEKKSLANPILYHGERAKYHYFLCLQVLLRMQLKKLVEIWKLPPEFEIICRDNWALYLSLMPSPPLAEPYLHSQEQNGTLNPGQVEEGKEPERRQDRESDDENGHERGSLTSSSSSSESEGEDENEGENENEEDPEMAELLRQVSETESSEDDGEAAPQLSQPQGASRNSKRWQRDDTPSATISVLVYTCWLMRIPIIYKDFVDLIESYTLPYLDAVRLLPTSLTRHLTKHMKQALSPHYAPTPILLHAVTSRLSKTSFQCYGIFTPELNTAPVLWRAVRHMGGNPTLYSVSKSLARFLELPLTLNPVMAPPALQKFNKDPASHKSDNVPSEVALTSVIIVALKLIYGLDGKEVRPREGSDPACTMPTSESYFEHLRVMDTSNLEENRSDFLRSSDIRSALEDDELVVDSYLDFCERALLGRSGEDSKAAGDDLVTDFFPLRGIAQYVEQTESNLVDSPAGRKNAEPVVLPAVVPLGEESNTKMVRPGGSYAIYSAQDVFGMLPEHYAIVLKRAACWTGVSEDDLSAVVERFERRLVRLWKRKKRREKMERDGEEGDDGNW
ncbi:hypothetical protein DFH11DRAFT_1601108 [Phellopilus nigrolimitatus]|nr:hypothetical protein DFH11DRAFT_1601108 [Phellopilus nigrolimitatus]